jgi:hypothetical protein
MSRLSGLLALLLAAPCAAAPSTLSVGCDPRVDVLGVVQTLAGWRKAEPRLPPSMADLEKSFAAHKEHPAVRRYKATAAKLKGDEPYVLLLSALSDPPEFKWTKKRGLMSVDFVAKAGGDEGLDAFLAELRDFTAVSGVLPWLEARKGECAAAGKAAQRELGERRPLELIERYLGRELDARARLVVSLIYSPRMYSHYIIPYPYNPQGPPPPGPYAVFSLLSHKWDEKGAARFGLDRPFKSSAFMELYYIVAEEAYASRRKEFEARAGLAATLEGRCHGAWQNCSLHIMVQALNQRLAALHGKELPERGPDPVSKAILRVAGRLEQEYEPGKAAGRYKSIDAFWPRLIDALGPPSPAR